MIETIVGMALVTWVVALGLTPGWLGPVLGRSRLLERSRLLLRSRLNQRSRVSFPRSRLSVIA
ncbi:MAG: hypothetical protein HYU58_03015 [Proteobacteria bacterium]|nr:hypothetical protein [Pseudomonadota bacterium]